MLRSPCCVRYEQDDHGDRPQVPAIVRLGRFCARVPSPGAARTRRAKCWRACRLRRVTVATDASIAAGSRHVPSQRVEPQSLPDHGPEDGRSSSVQLKQQG
jgi:hypothetical protein